MNGWIAAHDGAITAVQLLVWLALLVAAAPALWREVRRLRWAARVAVLGCGVGAFLISAVGFPLERFVALGHEGSYADCFLGAASPSSSQGWEPYVTYPLLRWGYWALGGLLGREEIAPLLTFNIAVRAATVLLFALLGKALTGKDGVAVAAGALLALHPSHAFWGTAIYNVSVPLFFAVLCLLLAVLAWRDGGRWVLAAAAASGSLVVAGRVEWGLLAPGMALLLLGLGAGWGRSPATRALRFWAPSALLMLGYGLTLQAGAGELTSQGGYHGIAGYLGTLSRQALIVQLLAPLDAAVGVLALAIGGVALVRAGQGRVLAGLLGFALLVHCGLATFNDFSYRHELLAALPLLLLASCALGAEPAWLQVLGAVSLTATLVVGGGETRENARRFYASVEQFEAEVPEYEGSERLSHEALEDGACYLITDNERLWGMGLAGSHFNLMEPGEAATHWRDHDGCVLWLYEFADWRVDGLAVRSRALKLRHWFDWEPIGHASFPDGLEAVVYRMTSPPFGLSEPPAGWGWGGEGRSDEGAPAGVESDP